MLYISEVLLKCIPYNYFPHIFYRTVSHEEKLYLDSCKDLVETRDDIRWNEGRKRKLEDELEEVNGQLFVMNRHLASEEQRNMHLKLAYVCKLKFSGQDVTSVGMGKYIIREDSKNDSQFEDIDDDKLISVCEKAEKVQEKKV